MQPGNIITIVAYDHESQPFEFCAKISHVTDDKIILSAVFNSALEHDKSPFSPAELDESIIDESIIVESKDLLLLNQYFEYRKLGFSLEKCELLIEQDKKFLSEKF